LNSASSEARAFAEVAVEVAHVLEVVIGGESVAVVAEEGMVLAAIVVFLAGAEMAELVALKLDVVPRQRSAAELADAVVAAVAAAVAEEPQLDLARLEHLHNAVVDLAEVRLEDPALAGLALEDLAYVLEDRDDVVEEADHYSGCT
jgi:hypothetical protein